MKRILFFLLFAGVAILLSLRPGMAPLELLNLAAEQTDFPTLVKSFPADCVGGAGNYSDKTNLPVENVADGWRIYDPPVDEQSLIFCQEGRELGWFLTFVDR